MKKYSKEIINKFIDFRKPTNDTVFLLMVLNLFACAIIVLLSSNYFKSFILELPFALITVSIYFIFKFLNIRKEKILNIFCGMQGTILTLICNSSCIFLTSLSLENTFKLLLFIFILDLFIILFLIWFSIYIIKTKKISAEKPLSVSLVALFSFCGIWIARKTNYTFGFTPVIIVFSCICSLLFVYYIKAYFIHKIEQE